MKHEEILEMYVYQYFHQVDKNLLRKWLWPDCKSQEHCFATHRNIALSKKTKFSFKFSFSFSFFSECEQIR